MRPRTPAVALTREAPSPDELERRGHDRPHGRDTGTDMDEYSNQAAGDNREGHAGERRAERISPAVRAAIREYFAILETDLRGREAGEDDGRWRTGTGADHVARERHHRYISATLLEHGLPYVRSRPPLPGPPAGLRQAVGRYLRNHPEIFLWMETAVFRREPVRDFARENLLHVLAEPPPPHGYGAERLPPDEASLIGADFLAGEQRNRSLARAGERLVLEFERQRLRALGLEEHANTVEHAAAEHGDGAGYDVQSWNAGGAQIGIRVKTTRYGHETPFYVSENELAMARARGDRYWIYRVFDFSHRPRIYTVRGPLEESCGLQPTGYRATLR